MTAAPLGQDRLLAMYYSDPGKGKTINLAHMAHLGKVIYIDAEKRLKGSVLKRLEIPVENIDRRIDVSYTMMLDLVDEIDGLLAKGGDAPVGVAWDSVTETSNTFLGTIRDASVARDVAKGKRRDPWSTEIGDYGDLSQQMRIVVRGFRDLDIHLGLSALERRDTDADGEVIVAPELTPGVLKDINGYMDVIAHCRVETVDDQDVYQGLMRPTGRWSAKDSFGIFPRYLVEPTFDRLVAYVNGDLNKDSDPKQAEMRKRMQAKAEEAEARRTKAEAMNEPAARKSKAEAQAATTAAA
jgi:hypothetical protein